MILVFGGTTEGRMVAALLQVQQMPFFYSTKLVSQQDIPGVRLFGEMNAAGIVDFCRANDVRFMVDAAHPFAVNLHENIKEASGILGLRVVRVERLAPDYSSSYVRFFDSYQSLTDAALKMPEATFLALTGVQTIERFRPLWMLGKCFFRILNTSQSETLARKSGIDPRFVIQESESDSYDKLAELVQTTGATVMLSKESGLSGGMEVKVRVAEDMKIPLWIVRRPALPQFEYQVFEKKVLLKLLLELKKELLVTETLKSGFTTGTCVCAAAKGALLALEEGAFPEVVTVYLPDGSPVSYTLFPGRLEDRVASCSVIKDSGDDPDVTHAKEIGCTIYLKNEEGVEFRRGEGIGVATLPGLQVAVGEPAINPVPRRMISEMVLELLSAYSVPGGVIVEPFVPEGVALAKRTFNSRVGVEGGISVLGTTGRIYPYSAEAFLGAVREQVRVAVSMGCKRIAATSGKRSEATLKPFCGDIPSAAFIHYGNFVGDTIKVACNEGAEEITLGIMLGKAAKLAEGHLDTHSREVTFNPSFLADIAAELSYSTTVIDAIKGLKLANAVTDIIPFSIIEPFYVAVAKRCHAVCSNVATGGTKVRLVLIVGEEAPLMVES